MPAAWNDQAENWLARIRWDDRLYGMDDLQRDIDTGAVGLFMCRRQGQTVGCVAVRVHEPDLVVQGVAGDFGTVREMMLFHEALEDMAFYFGCSAIRWHIERAGLFKAALKNGYQFSETVVRKWLR